MFRMNKSRFLFKDNKFIGWVSTERDPETDENFVHENDKRGPVIATVKIRPGRGGFKWVTVYTKNGQESGDMEPCR